MRIALLDQTNAQRTAGSSFTRILGLSLKAAEGNEDCEIGILSTGEGIPGLDLPVWTLQQPEYFPGEVSLRELAGKPRKTVLQQSAAHHRIDVILPLLDLPHALPEVGTIGWIPDFQSHHLPELFTGEERQKRAEMVERLSKTSTRLLLSSRDALEHLKSVAPHAKDKAVAIPFPSVFAFEEPSSRTGEAVERYGLPKKFALIANQFWAHKNHLVVIEALRFLRSDGIRIPLVCTGIPLDPRHPDNQPLSDLLQAIARAGLHEDVRVLGAVPYAGFTDLMRSAAVIIQPSRFEGWSTAVQDSLALGRPLICSNLRVHREQAPEAFAFFDADDAAALALVLRKHWAGLAAGPDFAREADALTHERRFAKEHGKKLLALCREAMPRK